MVQSLELLPQVIQCLEKHNKDEPPSIGKFDVEDDVKLVAIVAISNFTKDYLIKQKIIPNNI